MTSLIRIKKPINKINQPKHFFRIEDFVFLDKNTPIIMPNVVKLIKSLFILGLIPKRDAIKTQ